MASSRHSTSSLSNWIKPIDEDLDRMLRLAVAKRDWHTALSLRDRMRAKGASKNYWLLRHLDAVEGLLTAGEGRPSISERLRAVFGIKQPRIYRISDIMGGVAAFALRRIEFEDAAGGVRYDVVEKIYAKRGTDRHLSENLLFSEIDHERLSAPRHYGVFDSELFASVFMEFVAGKPSNSRSFSRNRFVERLWDVRPTPLLVSSSLRTKTLLERMWQRKKIAMAQANKPELQPPGLKDIKNISKILSRASAFVMHGDLECTNVIVTRRPASFRVIDWDKWGVAPVGFGLRMSPESFDDCKKDLARRRADLLTDGTPLFLSIAVSCACHAISRQRWSCAAAWFPLILRERDRLRQTASWPSEE